MSCVCVIFRTLAFSTLKSKMHLILLDKKLNVFQGMKATSFESYISSNTACLFDSLGVVGWCEGAVYLTSPGRPTDIGLQLGKACYPCSG